MLEYLLLIIGFVLLIKGADYLIDGASELAKKLGVSSFVIGLTIVAFGTSLPELIVNVTASLKGNQGIVLGNIIGSNLANILLLLGLGALIIPLKVKKEAIRKDWPMNLITVFLLIFLANFFNIGKMISRIEGMILLLGFFSFLVLTFNKKEVVKKEKSKLSNFKIFLFISGGLIALHYGSGFVVDNAILIANNLKIPEFFISATIVAFGTSLPELVTVIIGAVKKKPDISLGTILGSNLFNILLVLGTSALISPIPFDNYINFDLMILLSTTLVLGCLIIISREKKKRKTIYYLKRWHGIVLFGLYCVYIALMFWR